MAEIHQIIRCHQVDVLIQLLKSGCDLETSDNRSGHTPLMTACLLEEANQDIIHHLLLAGANVHAKGDLPWRKNLPLIALCVLSEFTNLDTLRTLIAHGADVRFRDEDGYTLPIWAGCAGRGDVVELLLDAGVPLDGASRYGESLLSVLSRQGMFATVALVLDQGANPTPLGWNEMHRAIAIGRLEEVAALCKAGAELEVKDDWERTPLLLAIHAGDTRKAGFLLEKGANRAAVGRCGKPPMHFPIDRDDEAMLCWLIDKGFDIEQEDESGKTALVCAVEHSSNRCFQALVAAGAACDNDDEHFPLMHEASHPEIIQTLIRLGANPADLEPEPLRRMIGLPTADDLPVSEAEYLAGRFRRYGTCNPELMQVPFWDAMVRCGWDAYQAANQFGDESFGRGNPVWCYRRFGMSLTLLPDGRHVQVAGEHEDYYDPDFCIYNDVIVHDGVGGFEIYGYPKEVFPPTDFHSATLVGEWIYLIGNLSYPEIREEFGFRTPIFRLQLDKWRIERVETTGEAPGWIHEHSARLEGEYLVVSGGKILHANSEGAHETNENGMIYRLNLPRREWIMDL